MEQTTKGGKELIYFIQQGADGPIKIGYTTGTISIRVNQIQTACHEKLTLLGTMDGDANKKRLLHAFFHAHKLHGEWFEPAPMVLNYIFALNIAKTLKMQEELRADLSINLDPETLEGNKVDIDQIIQGFEKVRSLGLILKHRARRIPGKRRVEP